MTLSNIAEKIKRLLSGEKSIKVIVFIGIAGMVLILISGSLTNKADKNSSLEKFSLSFSEKYRSETEKKLALTLSKIKGAGRVEVMLTVDSSEEYVYAEEIDCDYSKDGEKVSEKRENTFVATEENGEKGALVKRVKNPQVTGVVIICDGGGDARICENIYKAASAALGIPVSRIYVAEISD